ncbi:hypothetical protein GVAV_001099 [Gurleya vavrai]
MSYYNKLELHKECNQEEIKSQYQKLAFDNHPDRRGGRTDDFLEIKKAYNILGCKYSRSFYDNFGEEGFNHLQNETLFTIYTRVLSLVALKLFFISCICLIAAITLCPVFLLLMKCDCLIDDLSVCFVLFFTSSVFFSIYTIKCFILLRKYKDLEIKIFLKLLTISSVKFLLITIQILLSALKYDEYLEISKISLNIPILIFLTINIYEGILEMKADTNTNLKIRKYTRLFCITLLKILYVIVMNLNYPLKYKFLVTNIFLGIELFSSISSLKNYIPAISILSVFFITCYSALTNCIYLIVITFLIFLVGISVFIVVAYKSWKKILPKSKYFKYKCLEEDYI